MSKTRKQAQEHKRFNYLLATLLVMISLKYALEIGIPRVLFLVIIGLIIALGDQDEIIAAVICCIPLHESIDFYIAVVLCVTVYIFRFPHTIRFNTTAILILFLIFWELLHCFSYSFSLTRFLAEIIPFLALLIFLSIDLSVIDYGFVVRAMAATTILVGFTLLLKLVNQMDYNIAVAFAQIQRLGVESEENSVRVAAIHPNTLGILCVLTISGLMQMKVANKGKSCDMLMAIFLLVLGALTASRTFVACLLLMIALLFLSQQGSLFQKIKFSGSFFVILGLALIILGIVFPELMEYFYNRFLVRDITTGRIGLMGLYHAFIVSTPQCLAFGIGLHNLGEKVTNIYRIATVVPHNGIQEIILAWGVPGFLLLCAIFICMIFDAKKKFPKHTILNYIPLIIILFKIQAGQLLTSGYTMLSIIFAYLSMCADFNSTVIGNQGGKTNKKISMDRR